MSGWIKLQRDIMDHWIAQDAEYLSVWIRMLSEANFEPQTKMFNGQVITVGRGQLIFGLDSYSEKTKVSVMRLRRLVDLLEKHQMINRVIKSKYSLISIVNYDKHQADNRQATSTEQAGNNTIRIKEDKKDNILSDSANQTVEEIDFIDVQFARFYRHYPVKKSKVPAEKAFRKLMKGKREGQVKFWVDLLLNYHSDCIDRGDVGADKLHPSTFINQKRWEDEPAYLEDFKARWMKENGQ